MAEGDKIFAKFVTSQISNNSITSAKLITKFAGEYGFVNKRLPVWRIETDTDQNDRYYIEAITGTLSLHVQSSDVCEWLL